MGRPTLRDVARTAGVAPITASRILNGSRTTSPIAVETRKRVEEVAAELGYRLDGLARAMRHGRAGQIGVVVTNNPDEPLTNLAAYECILGINEGLEGRGYLTSLVRISDVDGHDPVRTRALTERLVDAFVVVSHMSPGSIARFRQMDERVVWLDTDVSLPKGCIRRDEVAAGRDAAGLLIAAGRTRVLWPEIADADASHYSHAQRAAGAVEACRAAGVEFQRFPFVGQMQASDLLPGLVRPGGGILVSNPNLTRRILAILAMSGVRPGAECGLACCDGDRQLEDSWPELSRVAVHRYGLGLAAAAMAADLIDHGQVPPSRLIRADVVAGTTA